MATYDHEKWKPLLVRADTRDAVKAAAGRKNLTVDDYLRAREGLPPSRIKRGRPKTRRKP